MDQENKDNLSRQALDELLLAARSIPSVQDFNDRLYTDIPVAKRRQLNTHISGELYNAAYPWKSSEDGLKQWGAAAWILLVYTHRRISEFYPGPGEPSEEEVRCLGMAAVDFYVSHLQDILSGSPGISREERAKLDKQVLDLQESTEGLRSALVSKDEEVTRLQEELKECRENGGSWRSEVHGWRDQVKTKDEQLLKIMGILEKMK